MALVIRSEALGSADARRLIGALDAYLLGLYPVEENFLDLDEAEVAAGRGDFLVARVDGRAVACGAIRMLSDTTAELKRMYVDPLSRGRGHGRAMLAALERSAARLGAERMVLETGNLQVEALALYRSAGYAVIPCFGEYAASGSSACFEKSLVPERDVRKTAPWVTDPPPGAAVS